MSATHTDQGSNDTHTCGFEVFDYQNLEVDTDRTCGSGLGVIGAGVYSAKVTVTDDDGDSDIECVQVVIYDPSAGFVTGGGWIYSAAGAYKFDLSLEGKATFGFVSKYQRAPPYRPATRSPCSTPGTSTSTARRTTGSS